MSLITRETGAKQNYTRKEDEAIIKMWNDGKSAAEIVTGLEKKGFNRSLHSVRYRLGFLSNKNSFDEIDYTGKNRGRKSKKNESTEQAQETEDAEAAPSGE